MRAVAITSEALRQHVGMWPRHQQRILAGEILLLLDEGEERLGLVLPLIGGVPPDKRRRGDHDGEVDRRHDPSEAKPRQHSGCAMRRCTVLLRCHDSLHVLTSRVSPLAAQSQAHGEGEGLPWQRYRTIMLTSQVL